MCTGMRFFSPQTHTFTGLSSFAKSCPRKLGATTLRTTCGVRRGVLRAVGRSAPSPGLLRGGVGSSSRLQYKRIAVAAALRTLLVIPNSRHSPLKMGPRGSTGALAVRRWRYHAGRRRHAPRGAPTSAYTPRGRGCLPVSGFQAHSPRARRTIREPQSQTVSPLPALRARCHSSGRFVCFLKSLHRFADLTHDDVNQVSLEARAPSCAVSGAPWPRAWPISAAPQPGSTGKDSGFQLLGILLLLRETITKLVRPCTGSSQFKNSRIRGLNCTEARRSRTFSGLVDRGGGPVSQNTPSFQVPGLVRNII